MYEKTYRTIGLHIKSPEGLLKYLAWDLNLDPSGEPVAFTLYKLTPFGKKSGLSGHDGSSAGKKAAVHNLRTKFKISGNYGEVSHKARSIVLAAGAPVVCAAFVDDVTGKSIEIDPSDPIYYTRILKGIGKVRKTMVGRPKGVPVTDSKNPSCPLRNIRIDEWDPRREQPSQEEQPRMASSGNLLSWGDVSPQEAELYDLCDHCSDQAMDALI